MVDEPKVTEEAKIPMDPKPAVDPNVGLKMVIAAVICPKCKKEVRLNAIELGEWIATKPLKCPECGEQPRPDALHLVDVLGVASWNISGTVKVCVGTPAEVPAEAPVEAPPPELAPAPEPKRRGKKEGKNA